MGTFARIFAIYLISNCFLCIQSHDVVLNCNFWAQGSGYTCQIINSNLTEQSNVIGITGIHMPGRRNDDVIQVEIYDSTMHTLPQILFNKFKNLMEVWSREPSIISNMEPLRNCSSLRFLMISADRFHTLKNSTFEECRNLNLFTLFNSQISFIEPDAFRGLTKLTFLRLVRSNLRSIDGRIFRSLQNLDELMLNQNRLERLNDDTFMGLNNLRLLFLIENRISQIEPDTFQGLTKLIFLSLNENRLKSIDSRIFRPLQSLIYSDLYLNELQTIDDDTFVHLSKLQFLGLGQNRITNIGRNFLDNFQSLNVLELRRNLCVNQHFSNVMGNIDFVRDQLEPCFPEIPANTINCRFLVTTAGYLCLVDNFNHKFDTFVAGENHVPGKTNSDVKIVRFMNSKLRSIPESIFTDFSNVRDLNLNGTSVESYPEIRNCGSLNRIILSSNELTSIPSGLFRNCANLNTIDLSRNLIGRIPCGLFLRNSKLQTINFSFNRITAIEPCFMDDLKSLSEIRFVGNSCTFEIFFIRNQADLDRVGNRLSQCFKNWD